MARDRLFFRGVGALNKKAVPGVAVVVQGIWASVLCLSGTYSDLLDCVISAVLVSCVLAVIGTFVLREKKPHAERPHKSFASPVLSAIYVVTAMAICLDLLIYRPDYT
jgi:APA family basic amino acid/polyamine antiporter